MKSETAPENISAPTNVMDQNDHSSSVPAISTLKAAAEVYINGEKDASRPPIMADAVSANDNGVTSLDAIPLTNGHSANAVASTDTNGDLPLTNGHSNGHSANAVAPTDTNGDFDDHWSPATKLKHRLEDTKDLIVCPGVYDGFSARIALSVGFDAMYMV